MSTDLLENLRVVDITELRKKTRKFVAGLFKDDQGKPIILTDTQCDIFNLIYKKIHPRVHIETHTRFGKSLTVALAVLCRVSTHAEKFSVVAGTKEQSAIIMGYIIDHIFDNDVIASTFRFDKGESAESIRRYKNKTRLNFVVERGAKGEKDLMGEVFITNAKGAMGFGAPNVVLDEAALVKDDEEALVFRMLGDSTENFYFKIGNPWDSGHFDRSRDDPRYFKLKADWKKGLKEGRISIDQVEEARGKPFFGVLFDCKRPPKDTLDDKGWYSLLTRDDIDKAIVDEYVPFGINKLGADVAGGGKNFSTIVQRHTNVAKLRLKSNDPDTMNLAEDILGLRQNSFAGMDGIMIDETGEGKGCSDILMREIRGVIPFNGAEKPRAKEDQDRFINIRASCYWRLRQWILKGGKLVRTEEPLEDTWYQLTQIKYKKSIERMRGKLQIMSKEEMAQNGIPSPDVGDGIMMTFYTEDVALNLQEDDEMAKQNEKLDKYGLFPKV